LTVGAEASAKDLILLSKWFIQGGTDKMKKTAYLLVGLLVVIAAPVFGQAFTDVPADHWAYDAANQLQKDGILIGYPDGSFQGKRTITRYEFATAIARMADWVNGEIDSKIKPPGPEGKWATQADIDAAIAKIPQPDLSKYATKDDVAALRKLIDEFRDEIAALGVDVDALKRDVAALGARVDAIEAELKKSPVDWRRDGVRDRYVIDERCQRAEPAGLRPG